MDKKKRCPWCGEDPIYQDYHDNEWGVPLFDNQKLFEFLILEGAQAGLSWITILKKRPRYRVVFSNFDPKKIARYTEKKMQALLQDPGIVRNRLKIASVQQNARAYLKLEEQGKVFSDVLWDFVGGEPLVNRFRSMKEVPGETPASQAMSKYLKKAGFNFVGPTICYAFMQATGMVNDHLVSCYRHGN